MQQKTFNLNNLNGANGFTVPGIVSGGYLGGSVNTAGDINGDNIADLVLGAPYASYNGAAYVIFGSRGGFAPFFNLNNLNGTNGFTVQGVASGDYLGYSVNMAGDINGDNISDLVLGAPAVNSNVGAAYVIFGGFASITWVKNELVITQGQTVVLTDNNLNTLGFVPSNLFGFVMSGVQGGRFTLVNDSNTAIFRFTPAQINSGQVQFISDRTAPVAYQVGIYNVTDGRLALFPVPVAANVTFTNTAPVVRGTPATQLVEPNQPFQFSFKADQIFNDTNGDPLRYAATLSGGAPLPSWMRFDSSQANQLGFSGRAPVAGGTVVALSALDPLNATATTQFEVLAQFGNNTVVNNGAVSTAQIAGGVIGGVVGLTTAIGAGLGFWRYTTNKNSRSNEPFADGIRTALNLKGVDNRPGELQELANDVAEAARNKITPATNCFGQSVIMVTDLNDNLQNLVSEVQILRNKGQERVYTV